MHLPLQSLVEYAVRNLCCWVYNIGRMYKVNFWQADPPSCNGKRSRGCGLESLSGQEYFIL